MYKIKKITNGRILINDIEFNQGEIVNVDEKVFNYIVKTFKDMFEVVSKPEVKKPRASIKGVKGKEKG
jgi:hypothetical protein